MSGGIPPTAGEVCALLNARKYATLLQAPEPTPDMPEKEYWALRAGRLYAQVRRQNAKNLEAEVEKMLSFESENIGSVYPFPIRLLLCFVPVLSGGAGRIPEAIQSGCELLRESLGEFVKAVALLSSSPPSGQAMSSQAAVVLQKQRESVASACFVAEMLLASKAPDAALRLLLSVQKRMPKEMPAPSLWAAMGRAALSMGAVSDAASFFREEEKERGGPAPRSLTNAGVVALMEGRPEDAISLFRQSSSLIGAGSPSGPPSSLPAGALQLDPVGSNNVAVASLYARDLEGALMTLETAVFSHIQGASSQQPVCSFQTQNMATIYEFTRNRNERLSHLKQHLQASFPEDVEAVRHCGGAT
uniref:Coatomer subunit epsilon n=1 Tax=Chromera velia CCMP2878 TaxID=1169474 RepID=A0A0G4I1A3_9ALVE|eukprot:Cvel_10109.t1-p1 / transcript=Cvel_10109.t1 / gene=Cvel_10109 / organism=Chromera_velia_CCMP2878 / gene_product=hypothetical protein / transcript_product=hypothetical protein / location=Cvel_scaffold602:45679-51284(-) / protein_length=359 / sequence_SO=supercontig / SO=protein_coding / is_pseudo=false